MDVEGYDKLNPKQKLFIEEYLIDLNATKAAERAGYSKKTANEQGCALLARLSLFIEHRKKERFKRVEINQDWVLNRLKAISDKCMQDEPVTVSDGKGGVKETGEYKFDSAGANRSTELIAKHFGFFEADNKQCAPIIKVGYAKGTED